MDHDIAFWIAHAVGLAGWAALLLASKRRERAVRFARACAALVAVGYLLIFLLNMEGMMVLARDYSVSGVSALFQNPNLALLGWVHYIAFDLWVGSWEAEEADRLEMPHGLLVPCLLLTSLFGPLGLLLFLGAARIARSRRAAA
jgi:hypothetical protein